MKARGYLVRIDAAELDAMFIGLDALIVDATLVAAGGISDVLQCSADTAHCVNPLAGLLFGWDHTHLWLNGDCFFLPAGVTVVVAPPEVALEHELHT